MEYKNNAHRDAHTLLRSGEVEKAMKSMNDALEQCPDDPVLLSDRAILYFHMGNNKLALMDMNRSVELDPDYSYRYSSRAYIKSRMGDLRGAEKDYQKAIELDPDDAIAYNNLGLVQEQMGHGAEAKKNFSRADDIINYQPEIPLSDPATTREQPPSEPEITMGIGKYWKIIRMVVREKKLRKEFFTFILRGFKQKN